MSGTGRTIDFAFDPSGSRGRRIEWRYFQLRQIQDGGRPLSWKISNNHISGMRHPIDFAFDAKVGFSGTAGSNGATSGCAKSKIQDGGWPPFWKMSNGHISGPGHPIDFAFDPRVGFSGRRIEWSYFRLHQIQDHSRQPSCIIFNGHISDTVHPVLFVFVSRVKVWAGENNVRGVIRLVTIYNISC